MDEANGKHYTGVMESVREYMLDRNSYHLYAKPDLCPPSVGTSSLV
jgi:hypothetical protein